MKWLKRSWRCKLGFHHWTTSVYTWPLDVLDCLRCGKRVKGRL